MAKKDKIESRKISRSKAGEKPRPARKDVARKVVAKKDVTKKVLAKGQKSGKAGATKTGARKATAPAAGAAPTRKPAGGKKRVAGQLALTLPLARARKLAGDLYQSASLALWADAIERAPENEQAVLTHLQDAICDVADLLKEARSTNPKHLRLYWVAAFDGDDLPVTPPRFVTAASEDAAVDICRSAFKREVGRRKLRAQLAPLLADEPQLHD